MENSVVCALRALAADNKGRSETARLRDVIEDVEAALNAGVKRRAILEALNQQGFKMTLKGFESAMYRIRKQRSRATPSACGVAFAAIPASTPTPIGAAYVPPMAKEQLAEAEAVRDALTNQKSREEKFSRYSTSTTLSKRLGQKKES